MTAAVQESRGKEEPAKPTITIVHDTRPESPSVSLNLQDSNDRREIRLLALFGIVLQLAVLAMFIAMTFHPEFSLLFFKDGTPAAAYAFPFAASGTTLLVCGLLICSHVVEASTEEEHYMLPDASPRIKMYWLQQEQAVADQSFDSIATWPSATHSTITMSRRSRTRHGSVGLETRTLVGVVISLIGFTAQFVGLRGMHSAASIAQLVAIGIMTVLRAWLRRNFVRDLCQNRLTPGHEIDWLALKLEQLSRDWPYEADEGVSAATFVDGNGNPVPSAWSVDPSYASAHPTTDAETAGRVRNSEKEWASLYDILYRALDLGHREYPAIHVPVPRSPALTALSVRCGLASVARVRGPTTDDAMRLADTMIKAINALVGEDANRGRSRVRTDCYLPWLLRVHYAIAIDGSCNAYVVPIFLQSPHNPGIQHSALVKQLDGVLSLWQYSVRVSRRSTDIDEHDDISTSHQERHQPHQYDNWLRYSLGPPGLLFLAQGSRQAMWPLLIDMMFWGPEELQQLVVVREPREANNAIIPNFVHTTKVQLTNLPGWQGWDLLHLTSHRNALSWDASTDHHIFHHTPAEYESRMALSHEIGILEGSHFPVTESTTAVAMICHDRLGIIYSRSLLQHFLHSACSRLDRLKGQAKAGSFRFGVRHFPPLSHHQVSDLSRVVTDSGFGSPQQAFMAVVSVLGICDILPLPEPIFDWEWTKFSKALGKSSGRSSGSSARIFEDLIFFCFAMANHVRGSVGVLRRAVLLIYEAVMIAEVWNMRGKDKIDFFPESFREVFDKSSQLKDCLAWLDKVYGRFQKRSYYEFVNDRVKDSSEKLAQKGRGRTLRKLYRYSNMAWIQRKANRRSGGTPHDPHDPEVCQK